MADSRAARMRQYYDARAAEYDATTYELAQRDPAAAEDLAALERLVASLPPARVLDAGCGTGWLTRFLRGTVVALDASEAMLRVARERLPTAELVLAIVPPLPFPDGSFERVLCSHFYSHLETAQVRSSFLAEAFRVAGELVVVEEAPRPGVPTEAWEERPLRDGSVHLVYKRYLTASALAGELRGSVVLETPTFVAVRTTLPPDERPTVDSPRVETVGVVSPGAMGSALAAALVRGGVRVVATLAGRSARTERLAARAELELLPDLDAVVREAEVVLSIVPPESAPAVAADVLRAAGASGATPLFVELNAIAPASCGSGSTSPSATRESTSWTAPSPGRRPGSPGRRASTSPARAPARLQRCPSTASTGSSSATRSGRRPRSR